MTFGWINWGVVIAFVLGTTLLGHALKGKARGVDGFFLGDGNLPWWAVSVSIIASQISAVTVIALPGAIFCKGGNLLFLQGTLLGFVVAKFLMAYIFVKPYYERKIYSPYDFIEHRLGSGAAHLSRELFLVGAILGHGVWLYYRHHPLNSAAAAFLAEQPSRAFPYFIVHELPVGVSGLVIAAIFAAAISTLDSALAALSETTTNGIYLKWIRPDATEQQCLRLSRVSVVAWGVLLSLLAYLAGRLVQNEGLLNLAYKMPVLTYGPMLMIALSALARRGSFPAILSGALAAVGVALAILILNGQEVIRLDEFWIYPITCVVFAVVATLVMQATTNLNPDTRPSVRQP
jgi:Na+/proline symporter